MALPSAYLTSTKNTPPILDAIKKAQAPPTFTQRFLVSIGFTSTGIGVLKALGFLDASGKPTPRYHAYLDTSRSGQVLARAIQDAYSDLFDIDRNANALPLADIRNKLKTLSQGEHSPTVIEKMAATFNALVKIADFSAQDPGDRKDLADDEESGDEGERDGENGKQERKALRIDGLVYSIQIILPESRDQAVYDVLFKSMKEHLFE